LKATNHSHATIKCPKCSGAGRLEITIPYVLTLRALKSLGGQPTIAEVHKATNERGVSPYATVQRVRRVYQSWHELQQHRTARGSARRGADS